MPGSVPIVKGKVPWNEARAIAHELEVILSPCCERIAVAGSLRRKVGAVGDLEFVVIPTLADVYELFADEPVRQSDLLSERLDGLTRAGVIARGRPGAGAAERWGARYKCFVFRGVQVDLFEVLAPSSWGVQLLLRTGSADFSRRAVLQRSRGGFCPAGVRFFGGHLERFYPYHEEQVHGLDVEDGHWEPLGTPEEEDVFRELQLKWIPPEARR